MENIVVFGRGKYFRRKYLSVIQNYNIIAILDNAVDIKEYDTEYQCEVYNPSRWKELEESPIICMSLKFVEMWKQLIGLGIPSERILMGWDIYPFLIRPKK